MSSTSCGKGRWTACRDVQSRVTHWRATQDRVDARPSAHRPSAAGSRRRRTRHSKAPQTDHSADQFWVTCTKSAGEHAAATMPHDHEPLAMVCSHGALSDLREPVDCAVRAPDVRGWRAHNPETCTLQCDLDGQGRGIAESNPGTTNTWRSILVEGPPVEVAAPSRSRAPHQRTCSRRSPGYHPAATLPLCRTIRAAPNGDPAGERRAIRSRPHASYRSGPSTCEAHYIHGQQYGDATHAERPDDREPCAFSPAVARPPGPKSTAVHVEPGLWTGAPHESSSAVCRGTTPTDRACADGR